MKTQLDGDKAIIPLAELQPGIEADFFALLSAKEQLQTRDQKPYFKVTFRDAGREVAFPIWADSAFFVAARDEWQVGGHYKLRAALRDTNYGPQLDIRKIRPVNDGDRDDGFDPWMCLPRSRWPAEEMYSELLQLAEKHLITPGLRALTVELFTNYRELLLTLPAATRNHHAYVAGFLEHVLSVTRTAVYLAEKYAAYYDELQPPLSVELVVAGAMLHDIGKLREIELLPAGGAYTAPGVLIGHMVQGRDLVREAAVGKELPAEMLLRLEHIILSHQRLPEWGSPKPPMTPEALLVHYADDIDAKYHMMVAVLRDSPETGPVISKRNPLGQQLFRGEAE